MMATAAVALFGVCSCYQIETTITVKKDGSGTITEEIIFGDEFKKMMAEEAAEKDGQGRGDQMDEMVRKHKKKSMARAKLLGEGVELVGVEKIDANGKLGMKITYKFANINKLEFRPEDAMESDDDDDGEDWGNEEEFKDEPIKTDKGKFSFNLTGGKLTISQKAPKPKKKQDEKDDDEEMGGMELDMAKKMVKGFRLMMKIRIEAGISKTDATYVEGDVITLIDLQTGKISDDPKKLNQKMNQIEETDFPIFRGVLKDIEGNKLEEKERISVEMK
jgi:hypothetical protein